MNIGVVLGGVVSALGAILAVASVRRARRLAPDIGEFLQGLHLGEHGSEFEERLSHPFRSRVLGRLGHRLVGFAERFMPRPYLRGIAHKLELAGIAENRRPAEHVARQIVLSVVGGVLGVAYVVSADPSPTVTLGAGVLVPAMGFMLPSVRLSRQVRERSSAIQRDLPDTLDLLAISVEAGLGFEAALDVVCRHFNSPLADEFALALREMSLGLPRREAFQSLKRRTEVPALSVFIMAMLQADALGIPVGRVLKTQAVEMRAQRRQWAREKAAKLPVKILVPLVLFIFPPVLVVVLAPSIISFGSLN